MEKVLFQTELNQLSTSELDSLGCERTDELGNKYHFVKNKSTTGMIQGGCCLKPIVSTTADIFKYIVSPDGAGAATASLTCVAGVPRTAIAPSGSATGCYGWIMVEGYTTAYVNQTSVLTDSQIDCIVIGTTISQPATYQTFDYPRATWSGLLSDGATAANVITQGIVLLNSISTGPLTVAAVAVRVRCK